MSRKARKMDAAAPVSPAERRRRENAERYAKAKAEHDASERRRARRDFREGMPQAAKEREAKERRHKLAKTTAKIIRDGRR